MIRALPSRQARCRCGVGRTDITPPADAYHRSWGAALHDRAEGIHRPLLATAVVLAATDDDDISLLFALDLGWLRAAEMTVLREALAVGTGLPADRIVVTFSHTHAAINLDTQRRGEPGGEHIEPYLAALPGKLLEAWRAARAALVPVDLAFGTGRCDLAMQRDAHDEERDLRVCGPDPGGTADDTVVIARATDGDGRRVATLVNYACHPTTLAWDNRLVSPDYVGALRETVEAGTDGAPCVFLQGAAGDLGPVRGFVGDVDTADANGRQLGHAVLSALETLPRPGRRWAYGGPVVSGATVGAWHWVDLPADVLQEQSRFALQTLTVPLQARPLPTLTELDALLTDWRQRQRDAEAAGDEDALREARARIERLRRAQRRVESVPADGAIDYEIQLWRLGDAAVVCLGGEPYQDLQVELRRRCPDRSLIIVELCNRPHSYLLPRDRYGIGLYQDEVCVVAPGSLEQIIDAVSEALADAP